MEWISKFLFPIPTFQMNPTMLSFKANCGENWNHIYSFQSQVFDGTLKLHKLPYEHLMEVLQSRFEIFIQDNLLSLPSHFQPFLKQIFFSLFKL